ncbi:MarR family transcriptional regulator [Bosea sp. SSUT16]|jgi:DNA-binding MarR family transcriptional regulator|uniref:MarR family transcriptional regulator n=1 Tax=Bosea spartocytisi TaxID=2773451 RepID=A0A927EAW1_9HYPH|nr:MarR family transcriptional regulator [Bosea spartocytisi]MBD3846001.1 MarR family transcriptional regulator [Bosea spartocytisi]MCT4473185.1 MarR family transcriptional regulator [Bosea spartocytisi]
MPSRCYCTVLRTVTRRVAGVYDRALAPLGINIAQYSLMRNIERNAPLTLTQLARLTELDRSTIGRNVRVLQRMGLVELGRGDDQREAMVELSERGQALLNEAGPLWDGIQSQMEQELGPTTLALLEAVAAN